LDDVNTSPQPNTGRQPRPRPYSQHPDLYTGHAPPVAVWCIRQDTIDPDLSVADALRLVAVYTSRGGLIVDLDADPALALAARAGGRLHLPVNDRRRAAGLDMRLGQAQLVVLAWPRPDHDAAELAVLLQAAAQLLDDDGHVIVSTAPQPGRPESDGHARLLDAAYATGLRGVQRIVIVHAPTGPDRFTYAGAGADVRELTGDHPRGDAAGIRRDLLVCGRATAGGRQPDRRTLVRDGASPSGEPTP
jgi:hypothetical protein